MTVSVALTLSVNQAIQIIKMLGILIRVRIGNCMYKYIRAAGLIVTVLILEITHIVIQNMIVIAIAIDITKQILVVGLAEIRPLVEIIPVGLNSITIRCIVTIVVKIRSYDYTHRSTCKSNPDFIGFKIDLHLQLYVCSSC